MALDALDPLNVRRQLELLSHARRALLPLPVIDRPRGDRSRDVFPPLVASPVAALEDGRVGVVAAGGTGAGVALVGVARAFEEAGLEPTAICACSGSVLWAAMWAAGLSAREMAELALSWQPEEHLGIQWTRLPRLALSALRGFTGLPRGNALERLLERRLWHMAAGETAFALHTPVYDLDHDRLEWFGSDATPDLTLGELARIAVAPPLRSEAVRVEGVLYVDGSFVDGFPAEPLVDDDGLDLVFAVDAPAPEQLEGPSRAELARRSRHRLGDRLIQIGSGERATGSGVGFYDLFLDRRRWPQLVRRGHETAAAALDELRDGSRALARAGGARPRGANR